MDMVALTFFTHIPHNMAIKIVPSEPANNKVPVGDDITHMKYMVVLPEYQAKQIAQIMYDGLFTSVHENSVHLVKDTE